MPVAHRDSTATVTSMPIDLGAEQVCLADEARPNDDPFDALICAAARALDLPLVTRDRAIQEWGKVSTVW